MKEVLLFRNEVHLFNVTKQASFGEKRTSLSSFCLIFSRKSRHSVFLLILPRYGNFPNKECSHVRNFSKTFRSRHFMAQWESSGANRRLLKAQHFPLSWLGSFLRKYKSKMLKNCEKFFSNVSSLIFFLSCLLAFFLPWHFAQYFSQFSHSCCFFRSALLFGVTRAFIICDDKTVFHSLIHILSLVLWNKNP